MNDSVTKIIDLVFTGNLALAKKLITASDVNLQKIVAMLSHEYYNHHAPLYHKRRIPLNTQYKQTKILFGLCSVEVGDLVWKIEEEIVFPKLKDFNNVFNHILTTEPDGS